MNGVYPHHRIFGRVHLVNIKNIPDDHVESPYAYFGICPNFNLTMTWNEWPMPCSLLTIYNFCKIVDEQVLNNPHRSTALCAGDSAESQTTAALLLGAYMIMRLDLRSELVMLRLRTAVGNNLITFGSSIKEST